MINNVNIEFCIGGGEKIHQIDFIHSLKNNICREVVFKKGMRADFEADRWIIETGYQATNNINRQIQTLLDKLTSKTKHISDVTKAFDVETSTSIVIKLEEPTDSLCYSIEKEFIDFLYLTHSTLDNDYNIYYDSEEKAHPPKINVQLYFSLPENQTYPPELLKKWKEASHLAPFKKDNNVYLYETGTENNIHIHNQLDKMFQKLNPKKELLQELSKNNTLVVNIIVNLSANEVPSFFLDHESIDFIHDLNAKIAIKLILK